MRGWLQRVLDTIFNVPWLDMYCNECRDYFEATPERPLHRLRGHVGGEAHCSVCGFVYRGYIISPHEVAKLP